LKLDPKGRAFFVYGIMGESVRKLGTEKLKDVDSNFDDIYDKYKKKAEAEGYYGELRFSKEHGKVVIFVVLE
jgi:hypothetical protein